MAAVHTNEDYSRFCVPNMQKLDAGAGDTQRGYETARVRELAPFLNRGTSDWPFKYTITTTKDIK